MQKKRTKVLVVLSIILIVIFTIVLTIYFLDGKKKVNDVISLGTEIIGKKNNELNKKNNDKKNNNSNINIFSGTDRPIAVMIDNHKEALPQAGLNDAYITYEMIVEGGETRLMALFKGKNLERIGPIRSSRHYFLDYALENDAIYVHYGWSPQAQVDIPKLGVNNINGITAGQSASTFWRVTEKQIPHNVVTKMSNIIEMAKTRNYSTSSNKESILNYITEEINLNDGIKATNVSIPYSTSNIVKYIYDSQTKKYTRYSKDALQIDWVTKQNIATKNIIITFIKNTTLNDGENKDRQTLDNIGTRDGYYITNGKAIKIKCKKDSRASQTIYEDLQGNEIKVNDGNTFIQICPIDSKVTFE